MSPYLLFVLIFILLMVHGAWMALFALEAFFETSRETAAERASILERAADRFEQERDRFVALLVAEAGKTLGDAIAEIREAVEQIGELLHVEGIARGEFLHALRVAVVMCSLCRRPHISFGCLSRYQNLACDRALGRH